MLSLWVTTHRREFADIAHHEGHFTTIENELELLSEHRPGTMVAAMQALLNEAMKLERSEFLRVARFLSEGLGGRAAQGTRAGLCDCGGIC